MKKIFLIPAAIAISSKVYAGKVTAFCMLDLLGSAGVMGDQTANTHGALTQSFGGATPLEQMKYVQTLPSGCSTKSENLGETAHKKTQKKGAATCSWEIPLGNDERVSVMATRNLPQDHTVQSFCDGESRGIKVLFKHDDRSVQMFFRDDGTLEKASIVNENIAAYKQGFSVSYVIAKVTAGLKSCIIGRSDTLPAVAEADIDSPENQIALRIMYNANPEWGYSKHSTRAVNDQSSATERFSEILREASPRATVEHSQTIGDGIILTSIYKNGALSKYQVFMRNEDGTCEVVGLNQDLATETALPLRQNFEKFAEHVGQDTVIITEGNGNKRQVKRFDLKNPNAPTSKPKESKCVITHNKIDVKIVDIQREGDCEKVA